MRQTRVGQSRTVVVCSTTAVACSMMQSGEGGEAALPAFDWVGGLLVGAFDWVGEQSTRELGDSQR
jgi:hypothetical protein